MLSSGSISPSSSASQVLVKSLVQQPDTDALRRAGVSPHQINRLWEKYYDTCYRAIELPTKRELLAQVNARSEIDVGKPLGGTELLVSSADSATDSRCVTGAGVSPFRGWGNPVVRSSATDASASCSDISLHVSRLGYPIRSNTGFPSSVPDVVSPLTSPVKVKKRARRGKRRKAGGSQVGLVSDEEDRFDYSLPGYGYCSLLRPELVKSLAAKFGPYPTLRHLLSLGPGMFIPWSDLCRFRLTLDHELQSSAVGYVRGSPKLVAFTTLVRSVPMDELRKSWRGLVLSEGVPCNVPGVRSSVYRVG